MTISPGENGADVDRPHNVGIQLFRAMGRANDGTPRIAPNHLGIRIGTDIKPDTDGNVKPATGGMSVTPNNLEDLPFHRLPTAFGGTGKHPIWWMYDVDFPVILKYRQDPNSKTHGFIEPTELMNIKDYQNALEQTAPIWTVHV